MIDRDHDLPVKRQAELVGISRGSVYYLPKPVSEADLALMRVIDEMHLEHPFAGARMLRDMLKARNFEVGRKHVATLMRRMGIEALYRKPNTSKRHPEHQVYPYLLRGLVIERANQVWAMDLTYVPMARGFVYLGAIIDWHSRKVLAWDFSISMEADFCVRVLDDALARHGKPEIFNTDQGSQFTSAAFTGVLAAAGIRISMDGRGRWMDNVFIERLWRSLKYEDVYLKGYADGRDAKAGIAQWIAFYNNSRPHQALANRMPMAVWRAGVTGAIGGEAVDMTLRLDNARALPTCPQPPQQQQAA